jgi:hypothetical protein
MCLFYIKDGAVSGSGGLRDILLTYNEIKESIVPRILKIRQN